MDAELQAAKAALANGQKRTEDRLLAELQAVKKSLSDIQKRSEETLNSLRILMARERLVSCRFDRDFYQDFLLGPKDDPQFKDKFFALIDGLDEESVSTVVNGLNRLKEIRKSSSARLALLSESERQRSLEAYEGLHKQIFQLSEDCFFWKGYMLPTNQFEECVFWDHYGLPLLEHPERIRKLDIIDAGAFIGDTALVFSSYTDGRIHSFEPDPSNYGLLEKTISMNGLSGVVPCQYALGEASGAVTLSQRGSCSTLYEKPECFTYRNKVQVPMISVDEYVEKNRLQIGLIKADLEGAEQQMLRGALRTIQTQKPTLIISIYHNDSDFFGIKPMLEKLNLGYCFKIRHLLHVGGSVMAETVLIAEMP